MLREKILKPNRNINNNLFISIYSNSSNYNNWKNNNLLNIYKKKLFSNIPFLKLEEKNKYLNKKHLKKNMLFSKIFNIDISNVKVEEFSNYILSNNIVFNSIFSKFRRKIDKHI